MAALSKPLGPWRSIAHLSMVRAQPYCACGVTHGVQAAHIRNATDGGMGIKPSDYWAVPLCHDCHQEQHRVGEVTFWEACGLDPWVVARYLGRTSRQSGAIAAHKAAVWSAGNG